MSEKDNLVSASNGMVGRHFVDATTEQRLTSRFDIAVVGEKVRCACDRARLSKYFAGTQATSQCAVVAHRCGPTTPGTRQRERPCA